MGFYSMGKRMMEITSWKIFVPLLVVTLIIQSIFMYVLLPRFEEITHGEVIMDSKMFYDYQEMKDTLTAYGEAGRAYYRTISLFDLFFPFFYASGFAFLLAWIYRKIKIGWIRTEMIPFIPLLGGIFDLMENLVILAALSIHPKTYQGLAIIANFLTSSKWMILSLAGILIVVGLFLRRRLS